MKKIVTISASVLLAFAAIAATTSEKQVVSIEYDGPVSTAPAMSVEYDGPVRAAQN